MSAVSLSGDCHDTLGCGYHSKPNGLHCALVKVVSSILFVLHTLDGTQLTQMGQLKSYLHYPYLVSSSMT